MAHNPQFYTAWAYILIKSISFNIQSSIQTSSKWFGLKLKAFVSIYTVQTLSMGTSVLPKWALLLPLFVSFLLMSLDFLRKAKLSQVEKSRAIHPPDGGPCYAKQISCSNWKGVLSFFSLQLSADLVYLLFHYGFSKNYHMAACVQLRATFSTFCMLDCWSRDVKSRESTPFESCCGILQWSNPAPHHYPLANAWDFSW